MKVKPSSGPRFAPSHFAAEPVPAMRPCPRCGREMLLFVTYYECPACLYIERKPSRYQPDRNKRRNRLLAALHRALPGWAHALHERDPLLLNPPVSYELPPELSFERALLFYSWLAQAALIILPGEHLASYSDPPFAYASGCLFGYLVAITLLIPFALYSSSELMRWLGFGWALVWIALSLLGLLLFPAELADFAQDINLPRWLPFAVQPLLIAYYLWFATFMHRDLKRLRESTG